MQARKSFLIKRGIAFAMFGLVLIQVGPSFADLINPTPDPTLTVSPTTTPSDSASPAPGPSVSISPSPTASPGPSGTYTYLSASDSPTPEPTLAELQDVILRVPSRFPVDPRATSVRVSPINVYSTGDVLVCISTTGSHIWLANQSEKVFAQGNGSKFLALSGDANDVSVLLNSGQGLRVGGAPRVPGATIFTRAAVVTRPTLNTDLCGEALKSAQSEVVALGLGMDTVKNPVAVK